jgi:hypothetical protein
VAPNSEIETPFPIRGVAGGWRDVWEEPEDHAQLWARAKAAERRQVHRAEVLGGAWRAQIVAETSARAPQRANGPA